MKILHATNHYFPCVGGIESQVRDLCHQLTARGHQADVLCLNRCSDGRPLPATSRDGQVTVTRVPFVDLKYYKVAGNLLQYIEGYDVIHVHGLGYFLDLLASTKRIHRKRLVLSTHGGFFHTPSLGTLKKLHFSTLTRLALRNVDRVVAVSKEDARRFSAITGRVEHLPNAIDTSRFRPGRKAKASFVSVGRSASNKRLDLLLRAFKGLESRATLTLVGDPGLQSVVRNAGMERSVTVLADASEREKLRALARAQFIVSASAYEGFGVAVLEGMAAGCVPVVSPIPAYKELVGDAGFFIDFSAPGAADRLRRVVTSPLAAKQRRARLRAAAYDWKRIILAWERIYTG
ncbi:MAG: glycosyltransferase family 4 protein [Candidatus Aenigmarchaeota archaeon]|nr:glycosyltransferase family 4 protein [Candidatus Aenigmarchaeota archaeon]